MMYLNGIPTDLAYWNMLRPCNRQRRTHKSPTRIFLAASPVTNGAQRGWVKKRKNLKKFYYRRTYKNGDCFYTGHYFYIDGAHLSWPRDVQPFGGFFIVKSPCYRSFYFNLLLGVLIFVAIVVIFVVVIVCLIKMQFLRFFLISVKSVIKS